MAALLKAKCFLPTSLNVKLRRSNHLSTRLTPTIENPILNKNYIVPLNHLRCMSTKKGFISDFIENMRKEMNSNKEMKDSLKKFREEADKLEKSDSLLKARKKYETIEAETLKGSDALLKRLSDIQDIVKESDMAKKGKELVDDMTQSVGKAAESMSKQGEQLSQSPVFKSVHSGVKAVKDEIADATTYERSNLYNPPKVLRKRTAFMSSMPIKPDGDASEVVVSRDSEWLKSWQSFKDNNQLVNKLFDMKAQYDESNNMVVKATRVVTEKVTQLFGGLFSKTEMSEALTEIIKSDPSFNKEAFLHNCRKDIIPNILEALIRGNLGILRDWCHEGVYNILATPIRQAREANYHFHSKVLDINHVDIVMGKMMEQGPVLVITFNAQQIILVRDVAGKVVEGDPNKIMKIVYVWVLCQDQTVLDPRAAWRLLDISASPMEQYI